MANAKPLCVKTRVSCWTTVRLVWTARSVISRGVSRRRSCCATWLHVASSANKQRRQALSLSTAISALPWTAAQMTMDHRITPAPPMRNHHPSTWMELLLDPPCSLADSAHPHKGIWVTFQELPEEDSVVWVVRVTIAVLSPWRRSRRRWRWKRRAWQTASPADVCRYDRTVCLPGLRWTGAKVWWGVVSGWLACTEALSSLSSIRSIHIAQYQYLFMLNVVYRQYFIFITRLCLP